MRWLRLPDSTESLLCGRPCQLYFQRFLPLRDRCQIRTLREIPDCKQDIYHTFTNPASGGVQCRDGAVVGCVIAIHPVRYATAPTASEIIVHAKLRAHVPKQDHL